MNAIRASQLLNNDIGIIPIILVLGVMLLFIVIMKKK